MAVVVSADVRDFVAGTVVEETVSGVGAVMVWASLREGDANRNRKKVLAGIPSIRVITGLLLKPFSLFGVPRVAET
jgi:hypothetical protein